MIRIIFSGGVKEKGARQVNKEINEDSCVLPIVDIATIDEAFDIAIKHGCDFTSEGYYKKLLPKILQKIMKLNDLAKDSGRTGLYDKSGNNIYLDHLCKDGEGKLFRVDYHAAAYWADYQYNKRELLGNVSEQCEIITTYEEDYKNENPIWKPPFKKVSLLKEIKGE